MSLAAFQAGFAPGLGMIYTKNWWVLLRMVISDFGIKNPTQSLHVVPMAPGL
jgi:hypothetical protein